MRSIKKSEYYIYSCHCASTINSREPFTCRFCGKEATQCKTTVRRIPCSPGEAQFLSSRQFQTEEIYRVFRMPPNKVDPSKIFTGKQVREIAEQIEAKRKA